MNISIRRRFLSVSDREGKVFYYGTLAKAVGALAEKNHVTAIGFEDTYLTVSRYEAFQSECRAEWVAADGVIEELRSVKRRSIRKGSKAKGAGDH